MRLFAVLLLPSLLVIGSVLAQAPRGLRPLPTAQDAWALADVDRLTQPAESWPYLRYIWVESGSSDDLQTLSLTVNQTLNRSSLIIRPDPVVFDTPDRGRVLLARIDLRVYAGQDDASREGNLRELTRLFEELQFAPQFNTLLTADTLRYAGDFIGDPERLVSVRRRGWKLVNVAPYVQDDRTYNQAWQRTGPEYGQYNAADIKKHADDIILVRVQGDWIDPAVVHQLTTATYSQAPVVPARYFQYRALTTIKDENVGGGLFATVEGGQWYDWTGVRTNVKKGTDLDNLLAEQGIGDVDKGITFAKVFDALRSDQKVAIFHSGVTDGPREIDILPSLSGRLDLNIRLVRITNDLKRANIDIGKHPIFSLLENKPDAHEVFYPRRNGLIGAALFNGQGKRQDEAPPDVARDWTQPAPSHGRLAPFVSCVACHEVTGDDNFRRLSNDAKKLLQARLEIFGDLTRYDRSQNDTLDRIFGAYTGDPERAYRRGRDDYAAAVLRATGPAKDSTKSQADVVSIFAKRQLKAWRERDVPVTPQQALRELGLEVEEKDAVSVLSKLLPPDKRAGTYAGVLEDPRVAALKAGISLTRMDFDLVYGFVAGRVKRTVDELNAKAGKK